MSTPFYDLASLVVVPSGYKASKVYAQKPLTTDGQLTFSRASTATRVNASGLIETVASNVPRLDYSGGATCPKLQLEPQRSNLCLQSQDFTTTWTTYQSSVSANTATAPDGTTTADSLVDNSTNDQHLVQQQITTSAGTHTITVYAKANTLSHAWIKYFDGTSAQESGIFNLSNGTVSGAGSITSAANGWYRLHLQVTTLANAGYFYLVTSDGNSKFYSGTGKSVFVWGYQVEAGAYSTSLIPTTTAAVTRLADACSKTGISSLIGQTEGTLFVDFSEVNDLDFPEITIDNNNNTDRIVITRSSAGNWGIFVASTAAATYSVYSTTSSSSGKFALAYSSAGYALYRNGVQIVTGTYNLPAALSAIRFNGRSTSDFYSTKKVAQALLFKTRLTPAQLAEITTL